MASAPHRTKPGKIWYVWQKANAFAHSLKNTSTQKVAKAAFIKSGSGIGVALAGYGVGAVAKAMLIPLLPLVAVAGYVVGGIMLMNAYHDFAHINRSNFVRNYIHDKEAAWKKNLGGPSFFKRLQQSLKNFKNKAVGRIASLLKMGSFGIAALSASMGTLIGLQQAGMLPAVLHYPVSNGLIAATNLLSISSLATAALSITIGTASLAVLGIAIGLKCRQIEKRAKANMEQSPVAAARAIPDRPIPTDGLSSTAPLPSQTVQPAAQDERPPQPTRPQDPAAAARAKARAAARNRGAGGF